MTHGFDLSDPLVCEGIVGDGCGGGRIFYVQDNSLFAFDPVVSQKRELLNTIKDAKELTKDGCIVSIRCESEMVLFDLSSMTYSTEKF